MAQQLALTSVVVAALLTACVEKGKGSGTRKDRPSFAEAGTIFDDGPKNQIPEPKIPGMDPRTDGPTTATETASTTSTATATAALTAKETLAACFNLPMTEIATLTPQPYATEAEALAAAQSLCAKLDKASFKAGNDVTAQPQTIPD